MTTQSVTRAGAHGPRTVAELLRAAAASGPDGVGLIAARVSDGVGGPASAQQLTWRELDGRTDAAAGGLRGLGVRAGDRVVIQLPNGPEFVALYLACARVGAIAVPVNPAYTLPELRHVVTDCAAGVLVSAVEASLSAAAQLTAAQAGLRVLGAGPDGTGAVPALADALAQVAADASPAAGPDTVDPESTAVLFYTSGTGGRPKGAMLSHRALLANLTQIGRIRPPLLSAADVVLAPLPLFHVFGLNAALGLAIANRATVVTMDRFDAGTALELVRAHSVSVIVGAPAMFAALAVRLRGDAAATASVDAALPTVRFGLSGSAPLPEELVGRFAKFGVPLHEGYGLSETAPVLTLNAVDASGHAQIGRTRPGSVGVAIPGVELQLRDPDGEVADADDPGRIAVRGANLFSGYWPDGAGGPAADGWFDTGDVAYIDADGQLVLVGRETELVLVNGFNVYPAEVEEVLRASAVVADVAVVGVPDEHTGEAVVAYVVPASGQAVDVAALLADAARSLARFKVPSRVEVVRELPLTVTGKVKKWQLGPAEPADREPTDD